MNDGVLFNVSDLWRLPDSLYDGFGETVSIAFEMTVVGLAGANGLGSDKRILLVNDLEEAEVVVYGGGVEAVLQHDDVRVVGHLVPVLRLEDVEGSERRGRALALDVIRRQRRGGDGREDEDGETEGGQHHLCGGGVTILNKPILIFVCGWEGEEERRSNTVAA